jgi:hypothetical protein
MTAVKMTSASVAAAGLAAMIETAENLRRMDALRASA